MPKCKKITQNQKDQMTKIPYKIPYWARLLKTYYHIWNEPSNLSSCKISLRSKNAKICDQKCHFLIFLNKNVVFWYFWAIISKNLLSYLKSASISLFAKFHERNKNGLIWNQKCLIWVFLGWNLKTILSYLKFRHPRICVIAKFRGKNKNAEIWDQKCLIRYFWPRMSYLGIFGYEFLKKLLSYLKSAPSNLSNCKSLRKNKNAWICDQKCLIWVFLG